VCTPGRVSLRTVVKPDLDAFFVHQLDPDANEMAAFRARDKEQHMAHWTKILRDDTVIARTVVFDGRVAGNVVSWEQDGKRLVGYWIGKQYWGRGIATEALAKFLRVVNKRPLYAYVAVQNIGSIRVLEKCGFTVYDNDIAVESDGIDELLMSLEQR
jgi:RimJ/RimL family protein N-acetyltransferase